MLPLAWFAKASSRCCKEKTFAIENGSRCERVICVDDIVAGRVGFLCECVVLLVLSDVNTASIKERLSEKLLSEDHNTATFLLLMILIINIYF